MTTIEKLAIAGIRSYDPQNLVTIRFEKPLTVIVGQNGSGKTTIIEALNFACTGDVPPLTDRGRTFVHDPIHCNESVVKAQIKIALRLRDGKPVVAIHCLQLTHKLNNFVFKTLDAVVRTLDEHTNKEVALSHKCADIRKVIPDLMGISKAILENVIFCHQEDSCWPLMEPKKLKDKFDDIFAITRWSKALTYITDYKKKLDSELKDIESDLKVINNNLEHAHRMREELAETKTRMANCHDKIKDYEREIAERKGQLEPLQAKQNELGEIYNRLELCKRDYSHFQMSTEAAYSRMTSDYEESDEELTRFLENSEKGTAIKKEELSQKIQERSKIAEQLSSMKTRWEDAIRKQGQLTQIQNEFKTKQDQLASTVNDIVKNHQLSKSTVYGDANIETFTPAMLTDTSIIQNVSSALNKLLKGHEDTVNSEKQKQSERDKKLQTQIETNNEQKHRHQARIQTLKTQIQENLNRKNSLEKEEKTIEAHLKGNENIDTLISTAQKELDEHNTSTDIQKQKEKMIDAEKKKQEYQQSMMELLREMQSLQNEATVVGKLKEKGENIERMNQELNQLLEEIKTDVVKTLNDYPPIEELDKNIRRAYEELKNEKEKSNKENGSIREQLAVCRSTIVRMEQEKEKWRNELSRDMQELTMSSDGNLQPTDIEALIEETKNSRKTCLDQLSMNKSSAGFYNLFNTLARKNHNCPVCRRKFENDEEVDDFIRQNNMRIKGVEHSHSIESLEAELAKLDQRLNELQLKKPLVERTHRAQEQIDSIDKELESKKQQQTELDIKLEELMKYQQEIEDKFSAARKLLSKNDAITRQRLQIDKATKEWNDLQNEINNADAAKQTNQGKKQKNLLELQQEYGIAEKTCNELATEIAACNEAIHTFLHTKQELSDRLMALREQASSFSNLKERKKNIELSIQACIQKDNEIQAEMQNLQSKLDPIEQSLTQLKNEKTDHQLASEKCVQELLKKIQQVRGDRDRFQHISNDFMHSQKQMSEIKSLADVDSIRSAWDELKQKENECNTQIKQDQHYLTDLEQSVQDIKANLEYRKLEKIWKEKKTDIENMENRAKNLGSADEIAIEISSLFRQIRELDATKHKTEGIIETEKRRALELLQQLNSDKYADIDAKHRNQFIRAETTKLAGKDLQKFYRALDDSLIQFHTQKMKEINAVLKELWQQTYKGRDIDYIEIQSAHSDNKRRNYNYSVLMHQGNAVLEMRGRCSAGQRVIASLLIRLALAETLCVNCGVMALDEPTTNLDDKNIESLAHTLRSVIERRKGQNTFQLIVITHSMEFGEMLQDHSACVYRVYKDEHGHSKVKRYNSQQ